MDAIRKLIQEHRLTRAEAAQLIRECRPEDAEHLRQEARRTTDRIYGRDVYIRALIEVSNYCHNDCYYCGIRRSNREAARYRIGEAQILSCCETAYGLGFRTFVLQGGEEHYQDGPAWIALIAEIRRRYPDCAITLSLGEKSRETYRQWFEAGADRYLLRHETADAAHYRQLHPAEMSLENRRRCLWNLKEIGYQVGSGFMVGSPFQTPETLAEDLCFLQELQPAMIGIGPFIPHHQTPFAREKAGSVEQTLLLISILRLLFPTALIPATTALGSLEKDGRIRGILHGANVVMPNVSPSEAREKYAIYDNKLHSGAESAEGLELLRRQMEETGYRIVTGRGDAKTQE